MENTEWRWREEWRGEGRGQVSFVREVNEIGGRTEYRSHSSSPFDSIHIQESVSPNIREALHNFDLLEHLVKKWKTQGDQYSQIWEGDNEDYYENGVNEVDTQV